MRPPTVSEMFFPGGHNFDGTLEPIENNPNLVPERQESIDVGINLHVGPFPSFENRVCLHLAAGHLVVSEPLDPPHGLEPGIDYVQVRSPSVLKHVVGAIRTNPDAFRAIRVRGHAKAASFRASRTSFALP